MNRIVLSAALPIVLFTAARAEDLNCNNGIVALPLHLDAAQNTVTLEGQTYKANLGGPKIVFSATDAAGDKIEYVLDRAANRLTETDHDKLPDGSFKTIALTFSCGKGASSP